MSTVQLVAYDQKKLTRCCSPSAISRLQLAIEGSTDYKQESGESTGEDILILTIRLCIDDIDAPNGRTSSVRDGFYKEKIICKSHHRKQTTC